MATMVLARLVLVDEMLLPPSERRLTSEVPFSMDRPYKLCQSVIRGLDQAGKVNPRRRRRWLRCPHANMRVVLAGEVWRQLMSRYLALDVAFEPLSGCFDLPLSLRDFRIAASFLEVNLSERVAGLVYDVCADTAGCNGEATLYSLQKVLSRYGPRGCGHWGVAAEQAASQLKFAFAPTWSMMQDEGSAGSRRGSVETPSKLQSPKSQQSPKSSAAPATPQEGVSSPQLSSAAAKIARRMSCRRMSGVVTQEQATDIAQELRENKEEQAKREQSPDKVAEIAQDLQEQKEAAQNRRLSSHRRMSGAAMPAQAAGIANELNEQERRKSNLASQKRGSTLQPPTPAGSSRPTTKGFRRVSAAMAKVALLQAPAKPKAKPVPMACPRCLKGDIPSFPYVSVGDLSRTHSVDSSGPIDESTSSSATSAADAADSEGELQPDDPEAARELGEDIVLSWATGVLTEGVVLCKDERGDYFRWLARIVLYDMLDEDVLQERAKSRGSSRGQDGGSNHQTSQQSKASGGSKRLSFLQVLSAASASMESSTDGPEGSSHQVSTQSQTVSTSLKSKASVTTSSTSFMSLIQDLTGGNSKAHAQQKRKADEAQQIKEAERDWSIQIPDIFLAKMRVDLGVRLSNGDQEDDLRNVEDRTRRGSMSGSLLAKYHRRVDRQNDDRAEREAEMVQTLHFLSVPELELQALRKELALAAELPPNPTGLLLVGGTAQVCQRILVPKNSRRRPVPRDEQDEQEALKKALAALQKEGRSAADMAAHTEVRRIAKDIVHVSAENTSSCYHMAGYEEQEQKDKVAAALRLLEHELFHSTAGSDAATGKIPATGPAGEAPAGVAAGSKDSSIKAAAPLLLTKQTAKRLICQAEREEAEAQAAAQLPTVEAVRLEPRRKARVKEALNQSMSDLSDKESDDSARSDLADTGGAGRARRRWSDQRLNSMLQRDYSPISNTPRVSASRTPQHSETFGLRSRGGLFGVLEADEHADEEFCPDVIDWHPSVKSLLDSVSRRGARVRNTARPNRNDTLRRCVSDSAVAQLPALSPQASMSPQRGAKGRGKKGFRKAKVDQFQLEGWRAKITPSDVGSLSGAGLIPKVEHEGMLQ